MTGSLRVEKVNQYNYCINDTNNILYNRAKGIVDSIHKNSGKYYELSTKRFFIEILAKMIGELFFEQHNIPNSISHVIVHLNGFISMDASIGVLTMASEKNDGTFEFKRVVEPIYV